MHLPSPSLAIAVATISFWSIPSGFADVIKLADNREFQFGSIIRAPSGPFYPFSGSLGGVSQISTTGFNNIQANGNIDGSVGDTRFGGGGFVGGGGRSLFDITFELTSSYNYEADVQAGGAGSFINSGGDGYAFLEHVGFGSIFGVNQGIGTFSGVLDPGVYRLVASTSGYWQGDKYDGGEWHSYYALQFKLPDYVNVPESFSIGCSAGLVLVGFWATRRQIRLAPR